MIKLKIQYNTYEDGEFTEENEYSLEEIIEVINIKTKPIHLKHSTQINHQSIKFYFQDGENYLKAEHIGKNAFHMYYCNEIETELYQGNYYLPKVIRLITLFYKGEYDELNRIIPKTSLREKKLIKSFATEDFVYLKKNVDLSNFFLWSLFPLIFLTAFLTNPSFAALLFLVLGLPFFISIAYMLRIRNNYKKSSSINAIKISRGINTISVWEDSVEYEFDKGDIVDLLIVDPNLKWAHRGTPFDSYGYTQIKLKNGKILIITSMVIDVIEMEYKVSNIPHRIEKKFYPYIQP